MGIHDGPELNRPLLEFTIDPDREPFPVLRLKVSDEDYVGFEIWSDGSMRTGDGSAVAAALFPGAPVEVTGARDTPEEALANLLTSLETLGLITDSTTVT